MAARDALVYNRLMREITIVFLLAAAWLAAAPHARAQTGCLTSSAGWQNTSLAPQSAPFGATFEATPSADRIDGLTGLSLGTASSYANLAAIVRFNNTGTIDARNGGVYAAETAIPYTAGALYRFRLVVDPTAHRYSVFVTPPGGSERRVALNYAFRNEQAAVSSLNNWALNSGSGGHRVCAFALTPPPTPPDTVPPVISLTAPVAGSTVAGSVPIAAVASDASGVAGVQFQADGTAVGAEDAQAPYSAVWNAGAAAAGAHQLTASARDAAGNRATSAPVSVTVDNSAPSPSCLASSAQWKNTRFPSNTAAFSASFTATPGGPRLDAVTGLSRGAASGYSGLAVIIRFNNAGYIDARDGAVYGAVAPVPYAAGGAYRFRLEVNPVSRRFTAFVTPPGGAERTLATNFAFRTEQASVTALDSWALQSASGNHQVCAFAVGPSGAAGDAVAPSVALTAPVSGSTVSGTVPLSATAVDNVGVAGVQFSVDGAAAGAEDSEAPYAAAWISSTVADGSRVVTATGRDAAGNRASSSRPVTVRNADRSSPTVTITEPSGGATLSGSVAVTAAASDDTGVAGVQLRVDGANLGAEVVQPPFGAAWDTTAAPNGTRALTAVARDAAGNRTTSAAVSVTVANAPPPSGVDRFGVKFLHPSAAGGKFWVSTWDNGKARSFNGVDPQDLWFDAAHGNASFSVDGKGLFSISGSVPRMYIHDPALQQSWRNVEMTVYAYRVADSGTAYGGIVCVTRTNHSAYGASETINGCDSRGSGARIRYDGHIDFEKETKHPSSSPTKNKAVWSTLPYNTWIGYKLVVYDLPNGNVKLEHYIDLTDGAGGGTWNKVNELEDNGANYGVGGTPCRSGIDPAIRLTASSTREGSETGRPNIATYCRTDNVGTNGIVYKRWSIREIAAP